MNNRAFFRGIGIESIGIFWELGVRDFRCWWVLYVFVVKDGGDFDGF